MIEKETNKQINQKFIFQDKTLQLMDGAGGSMNSTTTTTTTAQPDTEFEDMSRVLQVGQKTYPILT